MLHDLFRLIAGPVEQATAVNELLAMDDHDLADMGISRDQVERFVSAHVPE